MSLGEGQGFKIEENDFHKNIKNGEKLLFKNFAMQTKWQLWKNLNNMRNKMYLLAGSGICFS